MGNLEGARGTRFPKKGEGRARYIKHFALKEKRLMRPPGTPSQDISPEDATSLVRHKTWWSQQYNSCTQYMVDEEVHLLYRHIIHLETQQVQLSMGHSESTSTIASPSTHSDNRPNQFSQRYDIVYTVQKLYKVNLKRSSSIVLQCTQSIFTQTQQVQLDIRHGGHSSTISVHSTHSDNKRDKFSQPLDIVDALVHSTHICTQHTIAVHSTLAVHKTHSGNRPNTFSQT